MVRTDSLRTNVVVDLDSVPPDTPNREIVDRCWVWESHSEQKRGSSPGTDMHRECTGVTRESAFAMKDSFRVEPQILVSVTNVVRSDRVGPQEWGSVRSRDVSLGILSSLIAQLIRAAQEDKPPDTETRGPPVQYWKQSR